MLGVSYQRVKNQSSSFAHGLGVLTDMTTFHFLLLEAAPGERQLLDVKDTITHIVAGSCEELLYLAKKCIVHDKKSFVDVLHKRDHCHLPLCTVHTVIVKLFCHYDVVESQ